MLRNLSIENYALIESLNIDFSKGFSVITGETGAGKSIMLGALALILGQRADTKVLKSSERKCVIEGSFDVRNYDLKAFFEANDLDYEDISILRREIAISGKSRAFINDTPVTLPALKEIGERLVNVHSQHATITLNDANFQLALIDSFIGHDSKVESFRTAFRSYKRKMNELDQLIELENQSKADQDYFQFQFEELEKADLQIDEQAELENELEMLNHSEEIKGTLFSANQQLCDAEINIIDKLNEIQHDLNKIAEYHPDLKDLTERLNSNIIDIEDVSREMGRVENSVDLDPGRLNDVSERLDMIYHLQQKHRVQSNKELLDIKNNLDQKLQSISSLDEKIEKLRSELNQEENSLIENAKELTKARNSSFEAIEHNIVNSLVQLGMPEARFKIINEERKELHSDGFDKIKYVFNANRGGDLQEIAKIASGGELSRLMLCLKALVSEKRLLPTIIFDEIDAGVSGEIADKVGSILRKMSEGMQVIAITHLPQIAGKGSTHFKVYKEHIGDSTESRIKAIDNDDRIVEIAKMISGSEVSEVALENAKILLS